MPEVEFFRVGAPETAQDAYYACDGCCSGFIGPQNDAKAEDIKLVVCPRCNIDGSGGGIRRVDPLWVERRFEESAVMTQAAYDYREANPEIIPAKVHEARKPFLEQGSGEEVQFMTTETEEKPKRAKKVKTVNQCACGCNGDTFGTWCPGHDARFYGACRKVKAGKKTQVELAKEFPAATIKAYQDKAH